VDVQQDNNNPGAAWRAILGRESLSVFASAFVRNPVFLASVTNGPMRGAANIPMFFAASAAIYDSIAFTAEANIRQTTFLEWNGNALSQRTIEGLTVLAHDDAGLIERHGFRTPAQRRRDYYAACEQMAA
jgi:hypothetical protein